MYIFKFWGEKDTAPFLWQELHDDISEKSKKCDRRGVTWQGKCN